MHNFLRDAKGSSTVSHLLTGMLLGVLCVGGFRTLGTSMDSALAGTASAKAGVPSLSSRVQAAAVSALTTFNRALRKVNKAIVETGKATGIKALVSKADAAEQALVWRRNISYVDESRAGEVILEAIPRSRITEVREALSTKQVDIVSMDDSADALRVPADFNGHYLLGTRGDDLPDLGDSRVQNQLLRTTLLTSLERAVAAQDASAWRLADRLGKGRWRAAKQAIADRYRYSPNQLSENFKDGAIRVIPQNGPLKAQQRGGNPWDAMNAYATQTETDKIDKIAMGSFFSKEMEPFHLAFDHDIVWHENGHVTLFQMRPEWLRRLYASAPNRAIDELRALGVNDAVFKAIGKGFADNNTTRHGRVAPTSLIAPSEFKETMQKYAVIHEFVADLHSRTMSSVDEATVRSFIRQTDGDLSQRTSNPILEVGKRFGREHNMLNGVRSVNTADTINQAKVLARGQNNPYHFSVVINRWLDEGFIFQYEKYVDELTKGQGLDELSAVRKELVVTKALKQSSEDIFDLINWSLQHENMDGGPFWQPLVRTAVEGAREGTPFGGVKAELANILEQAAQRRGLLDD